MPDAPAADSGDAAAERHDVALPEQGKGAGYTGYDGPTIKTKIKDGATTMVAEVKDADRDITVGVRLVWKGPQKGTGTIAVRGKSYGVKCTAKPQRFRLDYTGK